MKKEIYSVTLPELTKEDLDKLIWLFRDKKMDVKTTATPTTSTHYITIS